MKTNIHPCLVATTPLDDVITKLFKVIESCETRQHFDAAQKMVKNMVKSWKLSKTDEDTQNPIIAAIQVRIDNRREAVIYDGVTE